MESKKIRYKVGQKVIVERRLHGHNYRIGETYVIHDAGPAGQSNPCIYLSTLSGVPMGAYVKGDEIRPAFTTRNEKADHLETEVLPAKAAELAALEAEVENIKADIEKLRRFKTDEAEAAHGIAAIIKSGGDEAAIALALETLGLFKKVSL